MSVSINSYGAQYDAERKRLAQDHSARSYHSQSFGADQRLRDSIFGTRFRIYCRRFFRSGRMSDVGGRDRSALTREVTPYTAPPGAGPAAAAGRAYNM